MDQMLLVSSLGVSSIILNGNVATWRDSVYITSILPIQPVLAFLKVQPLIIQELSLKMVSYLNNIAIRYEFSHELTVEFLA